MRNYLAAHHIGSFDPQEVDALCTAVDEVWETVLDDLLTRPTQIHVSQIREGLIRSIADAAMDGESSPRKLKDAGLRWLSTPREQ
jgi:hypothetical protein